MDSEVGFQASLTAREPTSIFITVKAWEGIHSLVLISTTIYLCGGHCWMATKRQQHWTAASTALPVQGVRESENWNVGLLDAVLLNTPSSSFFFFNQRFTESLKGFKCEASIGHLAAFQTLQRIKQICRGPKVYKCIFWMGPTRFCHM